ncbi:MAG TPA: methyl-accepting chemotaxis protein [Porticoccus sp.]|nr:methyl-accepting chemotaxis protein [Porticoccus sp.]
MDNRRSRVVINSKFQYQYALLAASLTVLLINVFIIINAVLPTSAGFPLSTEQTLWLAIIEVIFIGGVWWGSLIASHKIAGPVYVIVRQMEKLADGDLTARVRLRKKDVFQDEAVMINNCIETLQERLHEVRKIATEIGQLADQDSEKRTVLFAQLNQELSSFNTE